MPVMSRFALEFSNPSELHLQREMFSFLHEGIVRGVVRITEENNLSRGTVTLNVEFGGPLNLEAFRELLAWGRRVPFMEASWVNTPAVPMRTPRWTVPREVAQEVMQDFENFHGGARERDVAEIVRLLDIGAVSRETMAQTLGLDAELLKAPSPPPPAPHLTRFDLIG